MIEKAIEKITRNSKIFAEIIMKKKSILDLISFNMHLYEKSCKEKKIGRVIFCKVAHSEYLEEAKKRGLDTSEYPLELNYLEMKN